MPGSPGEGYTHRKSASGNYTVVDSSGRRRNPRSKKAKMAKADRQRMFQSRERSDRAKVASAERKRRLKSASRKKRVSKAKSRKRA